MKTEKEYNEAEDALRAAGWVYLGASLWRDPATDTNLFTSVAYKVLMQRAKRKPRLIHWQDWMGIAQELRRQLKPFGLTVKTRGVSQKKGDFIRWTVSKIS